MSFELVRDAQQEISCFEVVVDITVFHVPIGVAVAQAKVPGGGRELVEQ